MDVRMYGRTDPNYRKASLLISPVKIGFLGRPFYCVKKMREILKLLVEES